MAQSRQRLRDFITNPIWQFLAAIATIAALLFAIFTWVVPNMNHGDDGTPTPAIISTVNFTSSPTNTPPPPTRSLTCLSGTLCSTYSMNIWLTSVDSNSTSTSSTWNFLIINTGNNTLNLTYNVSIVLQGINGEGLSNEVLNLKPNDRESISVPVDFVPPNASMVDIYFDFTVVRLSEVTSKIHYMQSCQYSANACQ